MEDACEERPLVYTRAVFPRHILPDGSECRTAWAWKLVDGLPLIEAECAHCRYRLFEQREQWQVAESRAVAAARVAAAASAVQTAPMLPLFYCDMITTFGREAEETWRVLCAWTDMLLAMTEFTPERRALVSVERFLEGMRVLDPRRTDAQLLGMLALLLERVRALVGVTTDRQVKDTIGLAPMGDVRRCDTLGLPPSG